MKFATCGQVDDVDQHVPGLHHVHSHMGEAAVVLQEGGCGAHGLHHLMHQDELLCILQVPFCQIHVETLVHSAALQEEWTISVLLLAPLDRANLGSLSQWNLKSQSMTLCSH